MTEHEIRTAIVAMDKRHLVPADVAIQPPPDASDYVAALWAAGVKVLDYERFGSYQGDWFAHIEFPNGERYFIHSYFGSCSGCDSFEAEFGWDAEDRPGYLHRLRDFGRSYLSDCLTYEQAMAAASENIQWDTDAADMVAWVEARKP